MNLYILFFFIFSSTLFDQTTQNNTEKIICGTVFTENKFRIKSPNYPENYPPNVSCDYVLKNPVECPTYFKFDFVNFLLENSVGCVKDRLIIQNQDALCGTGPKSPEGKAYFSKNGTLNVTFMSDGNGSSTGFDIVVTRRDCLDYEEGKESTTVDFTENLETSTLQPEFSTQPFHPFHLPILPSTETQLPHCCQNTYNARRFFITSPNFPTTLKTKTECAINIQKSHQNICRLRLTFLYFHLESTSSNSCPYGYLKIDGKLICGCNSALKVTTTFENENVKTLIFKSEGVNVDFQSGFIIEVIQDQCPTKYYPAYRSYINRSTGVDQKKSAPIIVYQTNIEKAKLIHQNTEISNDNRFLNLPGWIRSFYYFSEPDYNALEPTDDEPTFIDTSTLNSVVTKFNSNECINWNRIQLYNLYNRYGRNLQTCTRTQETGREKSNCVELDYLNGYFKSPGYPFYYPKRLNICYRFRKQAGYCGVRIFMADFQLQNSYGCRKDYVLFENGNRYCGNNLFRQYWTIDLTYKTFTDMIFKTDKFFCGRGFYGTYSQIACNPGTDYPYYPPDRPDFRTTTTTTTTTTLRPVPICDRYISDQYFAFEVNQDAAERCSFQIRRFTKDVCKINLYFENFDLFCGSESLIVDNMALCGHMAGRRISVNFVENNDLIQIIYRSTLANKYGAFKFRITGEQITDDCLYPEPPVQRFIVKS